MGRSLPLKRAAFIEPLAAALAVLRAPILPRQQGVVLEEGRIANLTLRILHHYGFECTSVQTPLPDGARALAAESLFDYVIETNATDAMLPHALNLVKPGGVVVLKSRPAHRISIDFAHAVSHDITLAAVSYGDWDTAIALAAELPLDDLFGATFTLADFEQAFALARAEGAPKIFFALGGS